MDEYEKHYAARDRLREWFKKHDGEFLKFDRIPTAERRHESPDICAFIFLREKCGAGGDIVEGAAHDEIFLDSRGIEKLTEEDAVYLHRCGVRMGEYESLAMFV